MTKKDFRELTSYHQYRGGGRENGVNAMFYGYREIEIDGFKYRGFSHCVYARAINATKKQLEDLLYRIVTGKTDYVPWHIQLVLQSKTTSKGLECLLAEMDYVHS